MVLPLPEGPRSSTDSPVADGEVDILQEQPAVRERDLDVLEGQARLRLRARESKAGARLPAWRGTIASLKLVSRSTPAFHSASASDRCRRTRTARLCTWAKASRRLRQHAQLDLAGEVRGAATMNGKIDGGLSVERR